MPTAKANNSSGGEGGEQRVGERAAEDAARALGTKGGEGGDDGQHNGRDGQQLEQTGVDGRHKVHHFVEPCDAQQS